MKKSLLAIVAAVSCIGAAQAQSNVNLHGLVDVYVGSLKAPGSADRTNALNSGGMTTSYWGLSGTEDLGGGLKVKFNLGAFFQADDGAQGRFNGDKFFSRDANVGISGSFGTLTLGRSMAPNFIPTISFNPFGDSFAVSPLVMHANMPTSYAAPVSLNTTASDTGWSNQVVYSTPEVGGLSANLFYQFGERAGNNGANNIAVNAFYNLDKLSLTAFYEQADMLGNPSPTYTVGSSAKNWMMGATYDLGVAKLYGTYGQSEKELSNVTALEMDTYSLGLDVPVTKAGTVKAAYALTDRDWSNGASNKRQTFTLGYDHLLSKRTDVYSAVVWDRDTFHVQNKSGTSLVAGIRHKF